MTSTIVTRDTTDWPSMAILAHRTNGMTSVGLTKRLHLGKREVRVGPRTAGADQGPPRSNSQYHNANRMTLVAQIAAP